ncbi:hypothetical protein O9X98_06505 [Agrobacterium salinitolerans]|nr:hypothetical protein [Agrobacterium salinitolerans]
MPPLCENFSLNVAGKMDHPLSNRSTAFALSVLLTAVSVGPAASAERLLFFGDKNTFHGCLNCGRYDDESICNKFGDFGSKYNSESIWNKFGDVGSKYQDQSPWNKFGKGLKIVDEKGHFYGRFSNNKHARDRVRNDALNSWFELYERLDDLEAVRNMVCGE